MLTYTSEINAITIKDIPNQDLNWLIWNRLGYAARLVDAVVPDRDENSDNLMVAVKVWALFDPTEQVVVSMRATEREVWDFAPSPTETPFGLTLLVNTPATQEGAQTVLVIDAAEASVSIDDETTSILIMDEPKNLFRLCAEAWYTYQLTCEAALAEARKELSETHTSNVQVQSE